MSSILKALQKLEQEKAAHQDAAGINVSREILKQQPANSKLVRWVWIAGAAALVVIASLSALLLTKAPRQAAEQGLPAAAVTTKTDGTLPAAATAVAPRIDGGSRYFTAPRPTFGGKDQQLSRPAVLPPQQSLPRGSRTELPESSAPPKEPPRADGDKKLPQSGTPEQTGTSLTLSGIAWNKDSADRLAIINGQATAIGATVNGALVEAIMPDRVKVQSSGRSYELFLGKPLKTN